MRRPCCLLVAVVWFPCWITSLCYSSFCWNNGVDALIPTQFVGIRKNNILMTQRRPILYSPHLPRTSSFRSLRGNGRVGSLLGRWQQQQPTQQDAPVPTVEAQDARQYDTTGNTDSAITISTEEGSTSAAAVATGGEVEVPSYRSILTFVVTTAIILLSEPLLSLVDTIAVGHFGTTNQLAALGPATMICDSSIYFLYFLPIATTNGLATAMAQKQPPQYLRKIISQNLSIAALFGLGISLSLVLFGKSLLRWIILRDVATSTASITTLMEVLQHANSYILIRSVGATASVMGMVAQAICLASLDLRTPAIAVISASVSNLLGDYFLTRRWGSNGAAAATALATVTSATVLLSANRKRLRNITAEYQTSTTSSSTPKQKEDKEGSLSFLSLPDKKSFAQLFQLAGPVFLLMLGKIICYNAMTLRANGLGVVSMAAHAILLRLFFFFGVFADGLNQAAQTFFPAILYGGSSSTTTTTQSSVVDAIHVDDQQDNVKIFSIEKPEESELPTTSQANANDDSVAKTTVTESQYKSNAKSSTYDLIKESTTADQKEIPSTETKPRKIPLVKNQAFKGLLSRMLSISLVISTANTVLSVGLLRYMGSIFTDDLQITDCISAQSKWLGLSLFLHSFVLTLEGTIIAQRDVAFLAVSYILFLPLLMMRLRYCKVFPAVWQTLLAFQVARLIQFTVRISTARQNNSKNKKA